MLNRELAGLLESGTQRSNSTTTEDEIVMRRYPSRCRVSAVKNPTSDDDKKESLKKSNSKCCSSQKGKQSEESLNKSEEVAKTEEVHPSVVQQEVVARWTVRETLHMFQIIYRNLLQKEESRLKEPGHGMRVVLMAYRLFKEKYPRLDDRKYLGNVPGIQIGDEFHFRAECLLTGLHRQMPATIDFMRQDGMNVAVSIVTYGSYASFIKNLDNLVFPGSGVTSEDQKLMLGNLALKNSIDAKNPVRVIRGIKGYQTDGTAKSKFKQVVKYVYDGLYSVEKFTREKGKHGHYIFLFHLNRLPGQPELGMQQVKNLSISSALSEDISHGEEKMPINGTKGCNSTTTEDEMVMRRYPSRCHVSAVKIPTSVDNKKESLKELSSKSQSKCCSSWKRKRSEESLNESEEVARTEEVDHCVVQQEVVTRKKVRETLHMFQIFYRTLLQKEQFRLKEPGHCMRVVLMAYRLFKEKNPRLDDKKYLGNVPGIQIGDEFHLRVECLLTGLHRQMPAAIDFMRHDGMNVAVSIVAYGSYGSFIKSLDNLVFPGSGVTSEDQKLMLGNLALKNSIDAKNPVRVIWGIKGSQPDGTAQSKFKQVVKYVYDGLYSVKKFTREKGKHGHYMFLFHLSRLPGQPELGMRRVKNLSISSTLSGQFIEDISHAEGKMPINGTKQSNPTTTEDEMVMRQYPSRCRVSAVKNPTSVDNKKESLKKSCSKSQSKCCSSWKRKRSEESLNKSEEVAKTEEVDRGVVQREVIARRTVRETLHMFQIIYRKLLQKEESRLKEPGHGMRVVLMAYRLFKEKNPGLDDRKFLGNVPGIQIGDEFHFRAECLLTGLHRQMPATIDFMRHDGMNVAVSIVAFGSYASFIKSLDNLVFPGAGVTSEDQKLMLGNLALKNSIDAKNPVRVIRGIKGPQPDGTAKSKFKQVVKYVYDGLYSVEKFTREKGKHGHYIFLFHLSRLPGQPELGMRRVKNLSISSALSGQCIEDFSHGEEKIPINVVNTIDDQLPPPFKYTTKILYPADFHPNPPSGCDCVNGCSDSEKCSCAIKNGGEIPFNYSGAIVQAKRLVFECGPSCKCPPTCHNRVSQHGIKFPLEIFKTETMGWGVRSLTSIPSGSFICEVTGELLEDEQAQKRSTDEYLFAIGNNYHDESLWQGLCTFIPDLQKNDSDDDMEDGGFTLDASLYGNVGKFINHHCTPNLYAQNVLYDHDDKSKPHIMLFAAQNIPPLQELTYHYNYTIDSVQDSNGNIKKKDCYCGSIECTGRLY